MLHRLCRAWQCQFALLLRLTLSHFRHVLAHGLNAPCPKPDTLYACLCDIVHAPLRPTRPLCVLPRPVSCPQRETNCKIAIRGKGSVKEGISKDPKYDYGEDEELHVLITGETQADVSLKQRLQCLWSLACTSVMFTMQAIVFALHA